MNHDAVESDKAGGSEISSRRHPGSDPREGSLTCENPAATRRGHMQDLEIMWDHVGSRGVDHTR